MQKYTFPLDLEKLKSFSDSEISSATDGQVNEL